MKKIVIWIGALVLGAVLGVLGIQVLDQIMNVIATVYTRLFQLLAVPTIVLAVITTSPSVIYKVVLNDGSVHDSAGYLIQHMADFPAIVQQAAAEYSPSTITDTRIIARIFFMLFFLLIVLAYFSLPQVLFLILICPFSLKAFRLSLLEFYRFCPFSSTFHPFPLLLCPLLFAHFSPLFLPFF